MRTKAHAALIGIIAITASAGLAYEVIGIWPEDVSQNSVDYSGDDRLMLSVTLRIDKFRFLGPRAASES